MAVLTRPLFHSQERIDLEDLNQLLSGLRTDARLWTRQVYADKNFVIKGFDATGIGTDNITVNLFDSTLLFAGRRDLTGTGIISVTGNGTLPAGGFTIAFANTDGTVQTTGTIAVGGDADATAVNIGAAITTLNATDFSPVVSGSIVTITANRTGFSTIVAADTSGGSVTGLTITAFDYSSTVIESPADLSYFILESDATGDATRLTSTISASQRAATGAAAKTLFVYGTLVTEQGTPITKAFWDPSANSGVGAEFNQQVNTATDLSMQLLISETKLVTTTDATATEFFANVALCEIEVDTSGIILSIRDTRPILFEADDSYEWSRTNNYASMELVAAKTTAGGAVVNTMIPVLGTNTTVADGNSTVFAIGETIQFFTANTAGALQATPLTFAELLVLSGSAGADVIELDKFDLSVVPARFVLAVGVTTGAIRIVDSVTSNFFRDDKSVGNFRDSFSAIATEIKNVKGTTRWYEDPAATISDVLRLINSTIVGLEPNARYAWMASSNTADGTLSLALDPLSTIDINVLSNNSVVAGNTITFTRVVNSVSTSIILTAASSSPTAVAATGTSTFTGTAGGTAGQVVVELSNNTADSPISVTIPLAGNLTLTAAAAAVVVGLNGDSVFAGQYTASSAVAVLTITANDTGTPFNSPSGTPVTFTLTGVTGLTFPDLTLAGGVDGLGANAFLIGTDAEQTASHIASAINFNDFLSATFAESGTISGQYDITVGRSSETITTVAENSPGLTLDPTSGIFPAAVSTAALARIRIYGFDREFTFPAADYIVGPNEVLFVTLPDLDTTTGNVSFDALDQFRFTELGPLAGDDTRNAAWNTTNRAIFEGASTRVKTCPIENFENNDSNYWVAYRDNATTIIIRDVGELGNNETANIGHGISNATLSYIGAPDENDSTPDYPAVDTINAFTTDGAYLAAPAANDFNETVVAQSENLTSSINDLNNHLVSLKDTQYQNLAMKLVEGGFWTWDIGTGANGTISWSEDAYLQVPGLPDNRNTFDQSSVSSVLLADGDVFFVDILRQDNRSDKTVDTNLTIIARGLTNSNIVAIDSFAPQRDRIIVCRRVGDFIYLGTYGTIRLASGESAPLDSALQFFGLNSQSQLPRQLNTHISNVSGSDQTLDVGIADVLFKAGGQGTSGNIADDNITLTLSLDGGVMFWEGASLDFSGTEDTTLGYATGVGKILNEQLTAGTRVRFRSRSVADTSFTLANPTIALSETYYAVSIVTGGIIDSTNSELSILNARAMAVTPNIDPVIGRTLGNIDIQAGTEALISVGAEPPAFGGDIPVGWIRVQTDASNALTNFDMADVVVVGASGGGGGGTGNANQDVNNYLNRLNLSTFEYVTPVIASVSTTTDIQTNSVITTAGIAADGFSIIKDTTFQTTTLLDDDFTKEDITPERFEIQGTWVETTDTGVQRIDPNAKWFISVNSADTPNPTTPGGANQFTPLTEASSNTVAGWIGVSGTTPTLRGTNLSGLTVNTANINTIFIENHGYSQGHKINFSTLGDVDGTNTIILSPEGGNILTTTQVYVRVIDEDAIQLFQTVAQADATSASTGVLAITGVVSTGTFSAPVFNRDAGIIPRLGGTLAVRAVFDSRTRTLTGAAYTTTDATVRLRVIGDTNADQRSQANDALLSSLALFYRDELGVEGVNPNGLDDVNDILRSSHLVNSVDANASYGVAGRGVVLLDTAGTSKELSISSTDKLRIDGTELSTGHIIEDSAGTDLAERANLQFTGGSVTVTDDSANDRTIVAHPTFQSREQLGLRTNSGNGSASFETEYTWVCPASVNRIDVVIGGGGGSGAGNDNSTFTNGNGGASTIITESFEVVPGQTYNILVGSGASSTGGTNNGLAGGNSAFLGRADALLNSGRNIQYVSVGGASGTRSNTVNGPNASRVTKFEADTGTNADNITLYTRAGPRENNEGQKNTLANGGLKGASSPNAGHGGGAGYGNGVTGGGDGTGQRGGDGGIRITFMGFAGEGIITIV